MIELKEKKSPMLSHVSNTSKNVRTSRTNLSGYRSSFVGNDARYSLRVTISTEKKQCTMRQDKNLNPDFALGVDEEC